MACCIKVLYDVWPAETGERPEIPTAQPVEQVRFYLGYHRIQIYVIYRIYTKEW
jgi:hypothetical protein